MIYSNYNNYIVLFNGKNLIETYLLKQFEKAIFIYFFPL